MNNILRSAILAIALALLPKAHAQYTDLLSLSSDDPPAFGPLVSGDFSSAGAGSQTSAGFVVNGSVEQGNEIISSFASQNWSSYDFAGTDVLSLYMVTSAPNPNINLSLELWDVGGVTIDIWSGDTGDTAFDGYLDLAVSFDGTKDYSDVSYIVFKWNNSPAATIDTTMSTVAVVPEPSSYALLALSGLAFGGYIIRRRRRA